MLVVGCHKTISKSMRLTPLLLAYFSFRQKVEERDRDDSARSPPSALRAAAASELRVAAESSTRCPAPTVLRAPRRPKQSRCRRLAGAQGGEGTPWWTRRTFSNSSRRSNTRWMPSYRRHPPQLRRHPPPQLRARLRRKSRSMSRARRRRRRSAFSSRRGCRRWTSRLRVQSKR